MEDFHTSNCLANALLRLERALFIVRKGIGSESDIVQRAMRMQEDERILGQVEV